MHTAGGRHTLRMEQLKLSKNGALLTLHSYMHSAGRPPALKLRANPMCKYCPVRALQKFIRRRGLRPGHIFVHRDGSPVTRHDFAWMLHASLGAVGITKGKYALHSFRIGRATQMHMDNLPSETIKEVGRWRSEVFHSYIR